MSTRLANTFFSFTKPPRPPDVWELNCAFSNKKARLHLWWEYSEVSQVPALILPSLRLCPAGVVVCKTVPFVQTTAILTGILTMTCIAIERYQGIVFPLKMRRHYSPKRAYKMLGTTYGAICSKAHSSHRCHRRHCELTWCPVLTSLPPRRAGVDCLRPGGLTDAVCAAAGGRRHNNSTVLPVSVLRKSEWLKKNVSLRAGEASDIAWAWGLYIHEGKTKIRREQRLD